ncbi:hypothetical protein AURDEDRAFT_162753 [Auricularia subglabra TFB-10046 SS5]|nr:hypothetical protein AURDEDRAFT_162753 [Auricularia subglabra TFB-10046 SS5]
MALVFIITFCVGEFVRIDSHGSKGRPVEVFSVAGHPPRDGGIVLYGGIRKWDVAEKVLAIRFIPHQCDGGFPTNCSTLRYNASFFVDKDALGWGGFNASRSVLDWVADIRGAPYDQVLDLDLKETPRSGQLNLNGLESDILYPFDWYKVALVVAATSHNLTKTYPIIAANLFNPSQTEWWARMNYTYLDNFLDLGQATKISVNITLQRSYVVRISAILIVVFNWLVTIGLCYLAMTYIQGRKMFPSEMDSVGLQFAGLFALPTVRSIMPGGPPFGCLLDFIGIIPNLVLVSLAATLLLFFRLGWEVRPVIPKFNSDPEAGSGGGATMRKDE